MYKYTPLINKVGPKKIKKRCESFGEIEMWKYEQINIG